MPQPRPRTAAFPTAAAVAAQGLTVDQVDPDHLRFLQHLRPDGNSYAVDLPARGASPPVTFKYAAANGEAQGASVPSPAPAGGGRRAEEEIPLAGDLPWYETHPNMDEDYRNFWRQTSFEDGKLVLHAEEGKVVRYMVDEVPVQLSDIADGAEKKRVKEAAPVDVLGEDSKGFGVGAEEEEEEEEKVSPMRTDGESRVRDSPAHLPKKKVEQGKEEKGEGTGGAEKIKAVNRQDKMLNELPVGTLNAVNRATNSSNGHDAEPHSSSGFYGVVWPTHIMERPESSFKERLLRALRKPFSMVEYMELLHVATTRLPATKKRQTRRGVKYYNSSHETNESYFDSYPDLEEHVRNTSCPNQLALLRGFFFWLENVTNDDQFRPWRDDFRQYTIIPYE